MAALGPSAFLFTTKHTCTYVFINADYYVARTSCNNESHQFAVPHMNHSFRHIPVERFQTETRDVQIQYKNDMPKPPGMSSLPKMDIRDTVASCPEAATPDLPAYNTKKRPEGRR